MPESAVYITDQDTMLPLMQRNIELNRLEERVQACVYDWGAARPADISATPPDVILAADCVYFEPAFPLLQETLHDLIGPSTVCYFCFKRRRRADMHFLKAIRKQFSVEFVEDDPDQSSYAGQNIFLYVGPEHAVQTNADAREGAQSDRSIIVEKTKHCRPI